MRKILIEYFQIHYKKHVIYCIFCKKKKTPKFYKLWLRLGYISKEFMMDQFGSLVFCYFFIFLRPTEQDTYIYLRNNVLMNSKYTLMQFSRFNMKTKNSTSRFL